MPKLYPLIDPYPGRASQNLRAMPTGERREVQPGEWYISGSIPAAYRYPPNAPGPFAGSWAIASIVRIEVETIEHVKERLS
jgi:hypothetical protein